MGLSCVDNDPVDGPRGNDPTIIARSSSNAVLTT